MVRISRKKYLNIALLIYLMFAVTGFFAFPNNDSLLPSNNANILGSNVSFTSKYYNVDCVAVNTKTIEKPYSHLLSFARNGLLRVFAFAGIHLVAVCFIKSCFNLINKYKTSTTKDNIILKLRI